MYAVYVFIVFHITDLVMTPERGDIKGSCAARLTVSQKNLISPLDTG